MHPSNETTLPDFLSSNPGDPFLQWNLTQPNHTSPSAFYPPPPSSNSWWTPFIAFIYLVICTAGLIGNGLVIAVVLRQTRLKSVTDIYIANLAVADLCFLVGLPFLASTMLQGHWIFGSVLCRIFYLLTSINWFTSVFTLTAMSADRYLAVCHPVRAITCRTPFLASVVCGCIWIISLLAMCPIVVYATTVLRLQNPSQQSCTILWPYGKYISPEHAFLGYAFVLGFAIPIPLISLLYALVVIRLRTVGPKRKSRDGSSNNSTHRKHHKVTRLVFSVVAVYISCWLPYWIFQWTLMLADMPAWCRYPFQIITLLGYANSSLNPLLYAFLNDNFRSNFLVAFRCLKSAHAHGGDRMSRMTDRKRTIESRWPDKDTSAFSEVATLSVVRARGSSSLVVDDQSNRGRCQQNNAVALVKQKSQDDDMEARETML